MTFGYFMNIMPLWGTLTSLALLAWATILGVQLFSTWRWSTELRRWHTTRRRSYFSAPQPRYYF